LWVIHKRPTGNFRGIFSECVSNPTKFSFSDLQVHFFHICSFPQLGVSYFTRPENSKDSSQASINKHLNFMFYVLCNEPGLTTVQEYRYNACIKDV
jgi:hypothetical protein